MVGDEMAGHSLLARARRKLVIAAGLAAGVTACLAGPALAASGAAGHQAARELGAGELGSRSAVPWAKVGPDWALAIYSASSGGESTPVKAGPVTLYLVDPQGGRYALDTWSAKSSQASWALLAWSGDGSRALFTSGDAPEHVYQLTLRTGKVTSFTLPSNVTAIGYTRPDGDNVLAQDGFASDLKSKLSLQRYNLQGARQKTLASVQFLGGVAYQPAGATLAAGWVNGVELISNAGGVLRKLPVPGEKDGCNAVRWWTADTILASCISSHFNPQLWLVPASGAKPTALTPVRTTGPDLGDFNAWQLSSGLYLDALGPCGVVDIAKAGAHGSVKIIDVPGPPSDLILDATHTELLVQRINGCQAHNSLVWFNPASGKLKVAVPAAGTQWGVLNAVPYFVTGKY
jgi:hypothetical protein